MLLDNKSSVEPREEAKIMTLLAWVQSMLKNSKKNPQWIFCDDTIWHGPTFKNLAIPNDPDVAEIPKVIQNIVWFPIPRKFSSYPPKIYLSLIQNIKRRYIVGTASIKGSVNKIVLYFQNELTLTTSFFPLTKIKSVIKWWFGEFFQ